MSLAEIIALSALGFSIVSTVVGGFYLRGKLDGHAEDAKAQIAALARKVDQLDGISRIDAEDRGAREVRIENFNTLVSDVGKLTKESATTEARLTSHERECERRQNAIWERFDKVDRSLDNLNRQIIALATGQAGRIVDLKREG